MNYRFILFFLLFLLPIKAQALLADLSSHEIEITTNFTGSNVLLFGTTEKDGDIVVVVRGPERKEIIRRKEKFAIFWINKDYSEFDKVPSFYSVACNRLIEICARPSVRSRHQIGLDHLRLPVMETSLSSTIDENFFKEALLKIKKEDGLYPVKPGKIDFLGQKLFRTHLEFPANVPTGTYYVEVFELKEGRLVGALTTPLVVKKVGLEAALFDFAHEYPALYGIVAVIIALFAGWIASVIFQKE